MDTVILTPPKVRSGSVKRTIDRATGYVPADLLYDALKRADPGSRPALARAFAKKAGEGRGRYATYISGLQIERALEEAATCCGETSDSPFAIALFELCARAESEASAWLSARAFAVELPRVESRCDNPADLDFEGIAESLGRGCDAPVSEIVDRIDAATGGRLDELTLAALREAAQAERYAREDHIEGAECNFEDLTAAREGAGLPIFAGYEVDPETGYPSPPEYYDDIAEREADERAALDAKTVHEAEVKIAATRERLSVRDFLMIVRQTARVTAGANFPSWELDERLLAALCQKPSHRLERLVEVSIEVARERRDLPYDDLAAAARVGEIVALLTAEAASPLLFFAENGEAPRRHPVVRPEPVKQPVTPEESAMLSMKAPPLAPAELDTLATPKIAETRRPESAGTDAQFEAMTRLDASDEYAKPRALTLSDFTRPPGLVGDLVDWIEATAEFPSRELALGAALGFVAALAGRGYETPSRARTNLYMVVLAPSGRGKDHAPSCIASLAQAAGLDRYVGPARFMSASALRTSLERQPSMVCYQDEFGGILKQIDGPKVGIHNEMIRYDLLGLFSRAKDFYAGAAYAGTPAAKLYNPNLCLYGMSTPDEFWSALSSSRSSDGFLARFICFQVDSPKPKRVKPAMSVGQSPQSIVEALQALHQAIYGRGNLLGLKDGSTPFQARQVQINEGAQAVLDDLEAKVDAELAHADPKAEPFINRVYEHALKLALVVSVGVDPFQPRIDEPVMTWAAGLAWYATRALAREAERRIADNDRQRNFQRIIEIVRKAGVEGITAGKLTDKLGGTLDKRTRIELLGEAEETGRIALVHIKPAIGRPSYRYVAADFRPEVPG